MECISVLSLSHESAEMDTLAGSPWVGCSPALHSAASTAHYRWCHLRCQSWAHEEEKTAPSTPVDRQPAFGFSNWVRESCGQTLWPIRATPLQYFTYFKSKPFKAQIRWQKCVSGNIKTIKVKQCLTSNCCISCTIESPTKSTSGSASLHSCTNLVCLKEKDSFIYKPLITIHFIALELSESSQLWINALQLKTTISFKTSAVK